MRRMTPEEKFEWLYENWINVNRMESRTYVKKRSKKFIVGFIQYVATHYFAADNGARWHETVAMAWSMVRE